MTDDDARDDEYKQDSDGYGDDSQCQEKVFRLSDVEFHLVLLNQLKQIKHVKLN